MSFLQFGGKCHYYLFKGDWFNLLKKKRKEKKRKDKKVDFEIINN